MRNGFSLIELLVVIAIIGILAAVGVVGYLSYIDGSKDEVTKKNASQIAHAISIDTLAVVEDLGGSSDLNQNLTSQSSCGAQVKQIIKQLNQVEKGKSLFNETCYKAFNGNLSLNWPSVPKSDLTGLKDDCGFTAASSSPTTTIIVPRGQIMVACANSAARIGAPGYKIYTCVCTGESACQTTDVSDFCGTNASCRKAFMSNNPDKCPTPNTPQS